MNYEYIKNYQANDELMKSYFEFTQKVFRFDLKKWRNEGFWNNDYIPHSLIFNNQVIANISAAKMKLQINGKEVKGIQLGSVGVLPEYRGKGLSRILMDKILEEYKDYPVIFLFTTQENYYQRFGFEKVEEVIPYINISDNEKHVEPTKLTLKDEAVKRLLNGKLQHSSILDAKGNTIFNWFHLIYIHSENIHYIKEKDVIFIAGYDGSTVDVYDILSEKKADFEELREYILKPDTQKVRFHFNPDWLNIGDSISYDLLPFDEGNMFILGEFPDDITNFKFPAIAQT